MEFPYSSFVVMIISIIGIFIVRSPIFTTIVDKITETYFTNFLKADLQLINKSSLLAKIIL
jgi:hypothetical protein